VTTLGEFYNYITLEQYTLSDSDYGDNDVYQWTAYSSCFASVIPESQNEVIAGNQVYNRDLRIWKVRFDENISVNMRVYFEGNYYDITGIEQEGRRKFLILHTHKWNS
jgi:SPP1 family predicted phage head-tail adaptor